MLFLDSVHGCYFVFLRVGAQDLIFDFVYVFFWRILFQMDENVMLDLQNFVEFF